MGKTIDGIARARGALSFLFAATLAAVAMSACALFAGGVVEETVTLAKGWNAVYLESTPETADCDEFFAGLPVKSVGAYLPDAYSETAQYLAK